MRRDAKTLPRLIQEAIDKGATTVEEIHTAIADLPLKILEDADVMKRQAKDIRRIQHRSIGAVYDLIRDVNKRIGEMAEDILEARAARRKARVAG
jgi:uncharacterized NAD-dependent epimerase/dehydratase family protein